MATSGYSFSLARRDFEQNAIRQEVFGFDFPSGGVLIGQLLAPLFDDVVEPIQGLLALKPSPTANVSSLPCGNPRE